jgi:anti-sigma factor RsiW
MGNRDIWDEIELVSKAEHLDEEMFEYLSAYADGECSTKERRLVEAYLAENAEARAQLADLRMQAAIAAEGFVDPPEWLRGAILAKTVDRPRLKWPFAAAITAATVGAAAAAIFWTAPTNIEKSEAGLLANVVEKQPQFMPRVTDEVAKAPATSSEAPSLDSQNSTMGIVTNRSKPRSSVAFTQATHEIGAPQGEAKPEGPQPSEHAVEPEQEPDPEVTYAVAEYGGGRFEAKQPDVSDAEPLSEEPSKAGSSTPPAVLPDAREKLRDKVRKMNEEKLEIEGEK